MKSYLIKIVLILVAFSLANSLSGKLIQASTTDDSLLLLFGGISRFVLMLVSIWLIAKEKIGYRFIHNKNLIYIPISILLVAISVVSTQNRIESENIAVTPFHHFAYTFRVLNTGLFEEFFSRVLIFALLIKLLKTTNYPPYKAIVINSVIFGLLHVSNFFNKDFEPLGVIAQIYFGIVMGVVLQTILMKTKNIYFTGTIHALVNYYGMMSAKLFRFPDTSDAGDDPVSTFISTMIVFSIGAVILLPVCYWALRRERTSDIQILSEI